MGTDTIAAIATGMTDAGISIIRVSGKDSIAAVEGIFRAKSGKALSLVDSHTIHFGTIQEESNEILDEVLVSVMRAPKSFTGENTVEINCHGGLFLVRKILNLVLKQGVRLAEPGEFTKRAFLNGKMDLSKAEAVMDLIASKNEFAAKNSIKQLKGNLSEKISELRKKIIYEIAYIESALDDPEHFDLTDYPQELSQKLNEYLEEIQHLQRIAKNGRMQKDGIRTVIVGKPNAGKSSFLNMLSGEDRAIVTAKAGTTRDALEETILLDDIQLNVVDTAGIRETEDEIEKIGVDKARAYAQDADLILYMVDSSAELDEEDDQIISLITKHNYIILMNKSDLTTVTTKEMVLNKIKMADSSIKKEPYFVSISAREKQGLEEFIHYLKKYFYEDKALLNEDLVITNLRQLNELDQVADSLSQVQNSIQMGMPEDFFSIDLQNAYLHLGFIIGEEMNEDVVEEIFSKFCMGK